MASSTHFRCQLKANAKKDETELLIYDEIGASWFGEGVTAKQVVKDLADVKSSKIRVRINSAGGDVFEGLAIYNALRSHDAKVVTEIDSLAASIASVIALAGEDVKMADNAFFMIHNARGLEYGTADDMREMADLLDKVGGSLVNIYAERSGSDADEVKAWMDAETWFTAEEAKEAGFVTAITKGKKVEARADLSAFGKVPDALRAVPQVRAEAEKPTDPPADDETETPTAAGGAAPDATPAPAQQAPSAQGEPMSVVDTAAHEKTGAEAEKTRAKQIRALGKEHKVEQATIDGWLDADLSVQAVKDAILDGIKAKAAASPKVSTTTVRARAEDDPRRGFESHRDFLLAVMKNKGNSLDTIRDEKLRPLLMASDDEDAADQGVAFLLPQAFTPKRILAAVGSDEQGNYSDPHGGFLQPVQVLPGLRSIGSDPDPTVGLVESLPMAAPIVKINARTDKNHATSVSGGLTFARTGETAAITPSRMQIEQITMEAQNLVGAAHATEQVMTDSPITFASLLASGFSDQRAYHILNEKINGVGGAQYVGVLNADCTISISKETNQPAATINYKNVLKMRARCWGYGQAIWIANYDTLPELAQMSLAVGTGGSAVYVPGTFGASPDTLLGRPIVFTEMCPTVGTVGDIILGNWSQYLEGVYQPMKSDESIHVRFLNLERTFRFYERNCGAPWWRSALTPKNGSTISPFVTLATRA